MTTGDILLVNPIFAVIIATAAGGVFSVIAVAEFIKTLVKDYKADRGIKDSFFLDTKTGKRMLCVIAALGYTFALAYFGGLSDDSLANIDPIMRYGIFWIALSVIAMGSYDVIFKRTGHIQGTLFSELIETTEPVNTLVAKEHDGGILEDRRLARRANDREDKPPENRL